ncbi:MAG TPA: 1,4-alpha-glucan branching protein domain-containing protein [Acidobacteriaceae bacterium]|jgi:1,4-alpha-glucan branching enzyme|nr:1,4-alpha-glucan branching protein domain-containing protein [Acidobacteriaceae bacterium]
MKQGRAEGTITFSLHAHLPWVLHHGTWPHGLEWLLEAAAETYLPLLRVLRNLERDGLALKATISLSPVLLEQLAHPTFRAEFPEYLKRKIQAAQEDESYFRQSGDAHFAKTALYWRTLFEQTRTDFEEIGRDIVGEFRRFNDAGLIEVMTCCATHGYLPLLGTDESIRAQVMTGVATHERHLGRRPRGMWVPECGYRPAGRWQAAVAPHGSGDTWPAFERRGVEEMLAEAGIEYFFVDSHLVEQSAQFTPYATKAGGGAVGTPAALPGATAGARSLYQTYVVDGRNARQRPVAIFPRDPLTGIQVWSGERGYPGDAHYLDFHKKRWPGGHRYWQVTQSNSDMAMKTPYDPERAAERVRAHAEHFVGMAREALRESADADHPPILSALFDAELFGHWWFEGPVWLERVARLMASDEVPIALTTASEYLDEQRTEGLLKIREGSWGKNGGNEVWLNEQTAWTWSHIYPAEAKVRAMATEGRWRDSATGKRIAQQMCRELLLLESSDWQFLITTEAARDYAEHRFLTHMDQFRELERFWAEFMETGTLRPASGERLAAIEERDGLFGEVDPGLWSEQGPGCAANAKEPETDRAEIV